MSDEPDELDEVADEDDGQGAAGEVVTPERTLAGEAVWLQEGFVGSSLTGMTADKIYITEDIDRGKKAAQVMKANASVKVAMHEAETQIPLGKLQRAWYLKRSDSLCFDWTKEGQPKSFVLLCGIEVRTEMFDELTELLGDRFEVRERQRQLGEVLNYPLGCLGISVVIGLILGLWMGGVWGWGLAGGLVMAALVYLAVVALFPEDIVELVPVGA